VETETSVKQHKPQSDGCGVVMKNISTQLDINPAGNLARIRFFLHSPFINRFMSHSTLLQHQ